MESIITRKSLISVIKFNLENDHIFNAKTPKYRVKKLDVINEDSLECIYYSKANESAEIKKEIAEIMGSFNGFFRNGDYRKIEFKYYCVSAIDEDDNELLYAISSKQTSELIGNNAIEWLKLTYFQENTNDYRTAQAKVLIAEIENTLRETICKVLEVKNKSSWWKIFIDNKIRKETENLYKRQFDEQTSDGAILINYTFTLDLKKIVSSNWDDFSNLFGDRDSFAQSMEDLNRIRREEAHNRPISHQQLELLKRVHTDVLKGIFDFFPSTHSNYLAQNWKLKIQKIFTYGFQSYIPVSCPGEFTVDKIVQSSTNLIRYIENIVVELESIIVPVEKKQKHTKLITLFNNSIKIERMRIDSATFGTPKSSEVIEMTNQHRVIMSQFIESFLLEES
ncbi:hypothetical protein [Sphingobacterium tabacisoli]|uniref:Swt1-like HEPN domain-containing protein n=1 Tax=Sphingobacterium tabacisoli TaxID=2044855 RepID=A0ABW5L5G9_9SPHI|nr:hypothetical protein [Sphingobacterium tabacisoli]